MNRAIKKAYEREKVRKHEREKARRGQGRGNSDFCAAHFKESGVDSDLNH